MKEKTKIFLKLIIPPFLLNLVSKKSNYGYFGNYKTWEDVEKMSTGYSSDEIINKVRLSALKVKNGEATYERDSVLFSKAEMSWPLLSGLLWIASQNNNSLELVDFGGALGTSYYQNRKFLNHLKSLHWHIVEQDKFVNIGKKEFTDNILDFYYTNELDSLINTKKPQVMVISSSLQFLPNPTIFIKNLPNLNIPYLIFDKIPFFVEPNTQNRLMLQKVPQKIYDASYPVWIFGENLFIKTITENYKLIVDFNAYNEYVEKIENGSVHYKGFVFKKNI
jgi:putative methyltransferase (TIGR04325 family)